MFYFTSWSEILRTTTTNCTIHSSVNILRNLITFHKILLKILEVVFKNLASLPKFFWFYSNSTLWEMKYSMATTSYSGGLGSFGQRFCITSFDDNVDVRLSGCWFHKTCLMAQSGRKSRPLILTFFRTVTFKWNIKIRKKYQNYKLD